MNDTKSESELEEMVLLGTLVNGISIIIGTMIGLFFTNIPERVKSTALQAMGLVITLIGLQT